MPTTRFDDWAKLRRYSMVPRGINIEPLYDRLRIIARRGPGATVAYMSLPQAGRIGRRSIGEVVGVVLKKKPLPDALCYRPS